MPHKINPIRFENAEANLEISGGLLATLAQTLVTSRLQRDLTDSTTQRNIGVALGHSLLALDNLQRGLGEISLAEDVLLADLDSNWEVLGEAIQTAVRAEVVQGRSQISGKSMDQVKADAMAEQSIKAMIDPKDIAQLAVFLASPAAKTISGQVVPIDADRQRA